MKKAAKGRSAVRWVKIWVPQPVVSAGGKCSILKWVKEDTLKALAEEIEPEETKPEPTSEVLFLCSFEGCGKTFIDAVALRKHAHIHGERQHVCHYEGCGKKFLDSSKLKRHFLIHTGEKHFICPHEGCGRAFSLDFNLRSHMRTHSLENYRVCPYPKCDKRFTHESKLKSHIKAHHEKTRTPDSIKQTLPADKQYTTPKAPPAAHGSASVDRPYACPYEGCGKAYIHEYKLNLHLRREHPGHNLEVNGKNSGGDQDEVSDQDARVAKGGGRKKLKRSRPSDSLVRKAPPAKLSSRKGLAPGPAVKKQLVAKEMYEEDSEETEEEDGWRHRERMEEDDEETEDED